MGANTKIYKEQGGDALVVEAGDGAVIKGQASAGATPAQAVAIADVSLSGTYASDYAATESAVNDILAALRGVGIIASS